MPKPKALRIAVIGAGPIGLEAALYAKSAGFTVAVYERGQIGLALGYVAASVILSLAASPPVSSWSAPSRPIF